MREYKEPKSKCDQFVNIPLDQGLTYGIDDEVSYATQVQLISPSIVAKSDIVIPQREFESTV